MAEPLTPRDSPASRIAWRATARSVLLLVALVVICGSVVPAHAQFRADSWTAADGLPQNIIVDIVQARDGYLWMATFDGLVRFDGVRFVIFDRNTTPGIASNRFVTLYEAANGDLWGGTENAGIVRRADGRFVTYGTADGLPSTEIRGISGDEHGRIWVLSATMLVTWDGTRFVPVDVGGSGVRFYGSQWDHQVFWGIDGARLIRFAHGETSVVELPSDLLARTNGLFAEDPYGTVRMGLQGGGMVEIRRSPSTGVEWNLWPDDRTPKTIAWPGPLGEVAEVEFNQSLVRTITLRTGDRAQRMPLLCFFKDREGSVWLGTDGRGLYRTRRQTITSYSSAQGMEGTNVYAIRQDAAGDVWMGTWDTGVSRLSGGKITNYSVRDGLPSRSVMAIFEDRAGELWVSGHHPSNGGLRVFRNGRFVDPGLAILPDQSQVAVICEDRAGALWFGIQWGLVRFANGQSTRYGPESGLVPTDVRAIVEGRDGSLWIGGFGGLSRFDGTQFTGWTERDGLPSNSVRALYEDADGALWIGTYDGGLGRFKDGRFARITTREGLFNNGAFQILEDDFGNFWMTSNRGLYRVSKHELDDVADGRRATVTSVAYGESDGLPNTECNGGISPPGMKARDGTLWFPTQGGAAVVDPRAIEVNAQAPPVVIESFLRDGALVGFDEPVRISPGQATVEIEYTALSFINSENLRFRYKLDGLDRDWVEAGTRRVAYYAHLPPGEYTFTVIAANRDGVWSSEGRSLRVVVLPPFYRTWWFLTTVALLAIGATVITWRYRSARWRRRQAAQEWFARRLIASQEGERKRIAAELHDSLGQNLLVIKNWAVLGLRQIADDDPARDQLAEISTTASLSIDEVRTIAYNLRPYQLDRIGLTRTIRELVDSASAASGIRIIADLAQIDGLLTKEAEIGIYRIVQESINNVIKHSGAAEARVSIEREGRSLRLTIEDDGNGFVVEPAGTRPRGFGLTGLDERARLLGGRLRIRSAPGAGTTIAMALETQETADGD